MDYKAIKGSKIPIVIEVDGLGDDLHLKDASVGLEATFWCQSQVTVMAANTVTYDKDDTDVMFEMPDGDGNQYVCLVDTSSLGTGFLWCGAKITYTDTTMIKQVIEIYPAPCNVQILEPYIRKTK